MTYKQRVVARLTNTKYFESYYELEEGIREHNLNDVLAEILEITRKDLLEIPRTNEKAQKLIVEWWNNNKNIPEINNHRVGYFLLYHLREKYNEVIKE